MAYPTSIDSPSTPGTFLSSNPHSSLHIASNTSIVAIETKLGVNSSAVATSIDYLLKNTASSDPGHKHTFTSLSDFIITSPVTSDVMQYNGSKWVNSAGLFKFGGTGVDGSLSITSGVTTIDLGGAAVVVKNYSSISITATGALGFSNPHPNGTLVILKSVGNVTLTSSATPLIDLRLIGGSAGNPGKTSFFLTGGGGTGVTTSGTTTAGTSAALTYSQLSSTYQLYKYPFFCVGGGSGTGGQTGGGVAGIGKIGGGGLIVECGGAFNFTTTNGINVSGTNGGAASGSGGGTAGGGGGSGSGFCAIWYNTLIANSGTILASGGTGGASYTNASTTTADGGGGGGSVIAGGGGAIGTNQSGRTGYTGGDGIGLIIKNIDFT